MKDVKIGTIKQLLNLFKSLVTFVHSKPKTSLGTFIAIMVTIVVLMTSYRNYLEISKIKTSQAEETPSPEKMQQLLRQNVENNIAFNNILKKLVEEGADRAYVMKFHNGTRDINGVHFMYISTTNEMTKPGVQNVLANVQDVPTASINQEWIKSFLDNKCVEAKTSNMEPSNAMTSLLLKLGIVEVHLCPIYDTDKNYLLGIAGVSYVGREPSREMNEKVDNMLMALNMSMAALMTPDSNK